MLPFAQVSNQFDESAPFFVHHLAYGQFYRGFAAGPVPFQPSLLLHRLEMLLSARSAQRGNEGRKEMLKNGGKRGGKRGKGIYLVGERVEIDGVVFVVDGNNDWRIGGCELLEIRLDAVCSYVRERGPCFRAFHLIAPVVLHCRHVRVEQHV